MADNPNRPIDFRAAIAALANEQQKSKQRGPGRPRKENQHEAGGASHQGGEGDQGASGSGDAAQSRSARALLKQLGEEFVRLREQNRTSAWAAFQRRIASNLDILVPNAIGLKEATGLLREIEEFMKNDAGASVATPSEIVREWLNAGNERVN